MKSDNIVALNHDFQGFEHKPHTGYEDEPNEEQEILDAISSDAGAIEGVRKLIDKKLDDQRVRINLEWFVAIFMIGIAAAGVYFF